MLMLRLPKLDLQGALLTLGNLEGFSSSIQRNGFVSVFWWVLGQVSVRASAGALEVCCNQCKCHRPALPPSSFPALSEGLAAEVPNIANFVPSDPAVMNIRSGGAAALLCAHRPALCLLWHAGSSSSALGLQFSLSLKGKKGNCIFLL